MKQQNSKPKDTKRTQKREKRPPKKITATYLHNAGLYYLQRFAASSGHFRTVMMRKVDKSCYFHKEQDRVECARMVDELVGKFQEIGLLDDAAYTRAMVTSMRRRGLSARAILARLSAKGLSNETVGEALDRHDEDSPAQGDLVAAIRLARKRRIGPFGEKEKDKALALLARNGFSYDIANTVLEMDKEEAEELIGFRG